jgi:hypothetical protein
MAPVPVVVVVSRTRSALIKAIYLSSVAVFVL